MAPFNHRAGAIIPLDNPQGLYIFVKNKGNNPNRKIYLMIHKYVHFIGEKALIADAASITLIIIIRIMNYQIRLLWQDVSFILKYFIG